MDDQFTDRLSEYLDDEVDGQERAEIDAHLASCADCRQVLADLRRVAVTAGTLAPRAPAEDLWPAIARQTASRPPRRVTFTLPQAAAAALVVSLLSGGLVWRLHPWAGAGRDAPQASTAGTQGDGTPRPRAGGATGPDVEQPVDVSPVSAGDAQYDSAVTDLQRALAQGRSRLDPTTVTAIEQSLDTIDRAIAQARQALDRDPANAYLSGHLMETRRRKLDLLRRAAALAMN